MPDKYMCMNEACERKTDCYRYMAVPSEPWQSYFKPDEKNCEDFTPIDGRRTSDED